MMEKIKALYAQYGEILRYLVVGFAVTVLDIVLFALLNSVTGLHYQVAKFITWVIVVAIAFWLNKKVVFQTKAADGLSLLREAGSFVAMRVVTYLISVGLLYLGVEVLHWDENLSNILCNVIVIILNYVLSKLVVFRKDTPPAP